MKATLPGVMVEEGEDDFAARRREEADWILSAIVGAIVTDKLPPDDAAAWAKIAAHEIELLGQTPELARAA